MRNQAAIVGIGAVPFGRRGEFADQGLVRLAIEAITAACDGRRDPAQGRRRLLLVLQLRRTGRARDRVRRRAAAVRVADLGRWGRVDVRCVPERGDGRRHRSGRFRRRAQGRDDGGEQAVRAGVRADRTGHPRGGRAVRVLGALRPAVARADVRPRGAPPHAPLRHHQRADGARRDERARHGAHESRTRGSASRSPSTTTRRAP